MSAFLYSKVYSYLKLDSYSKKQIPPQKTNPQKAPQNIVAQDSSSAFIFFKK